MIVVGRLKYSRERDKPISCYGGGDKPTRHYIRADSGVIGKNIEMAVTRCQSISTNKRVGTRESTDSMSMGKRGLFLFHKSVRVE